MSRRAAAALLVAGLLLGGCALLQPGDDAASAETPGAPPGPPVLELEIEAPRELATLLRTHLDLARLQQLAGGEPLATQELQRLEAAAPAQVRALLETEGFFDAHVTVESRPGDPPHARIMVEPGPRARVETVQIDVSGPLQQRVEAGDADARALRDALRQHWKLAPGEAFRTPAWDEAKTAALVRLRAEGYAAARWEQTEARVDAGSHRVELALAVDSGPLFRTGELRIVGLERQGEQTVRNLADFEPGTPARESLLLDYQERLQKSGLFDRATVTIDADPEHADATPVTVRLHEQKLQQVIVGVGYSANNGPRIQLDHTHRRPFDWPATLRNKIEWGGVEQSWDAELSSQAQTGMWRNLIGETLDRVESSSDVVTSSRLKVGRAQQTERNEKLYFVGWDRSLVDNKDGVDPGRADALSLNYNRVWRRVDSVLLPTDGWGLSVESGAGFATSNYAERGPFARLWGRLQFWRPLGNDWFGQARLELGEVFVRSNVAVPDTLRFRAGGDDSVRGYAYRSLGPDAEAKETESGNMVFTSSVEIGRPVSDDLPSLWWAAFVDAGNAANSWREIDPALGYGLGLRWRSPIGPLKVDFAYGERVKNLRTHITVGVTF